MKWSCCSPEPVREHFLKICWDVWSQIPTPRTPSSIIYFSPSYLGAISNSRCAFATAAQFQIPNRIATRSPTYQSTPDPIRLPHTSVSRNGESSMWPVVESVLEIRYRHPIQTIFSLHATVSDAWPGRKLCWGHVVTLLLLQQVLISSKFCLPSL